MLFFCVIHKDADDPTGTLCSSLFIHNTILHNNHEHVYGSRTTEYVLTVVMIDGI